VAHDVSNCTPPRDLCLLGENPAAQCNPTANPFAFCLPTTGNAEFCANGLGFSAANNCKLCAKDKDCELLGFGPGAACVLLVNGMCSTLCPTTGNRACFSRGI
jgi:hypothetical protein